MVVGALGPWVNVTTGLIDITRSGVQDGRDGIIIVICGGVLALMAALWIASPNAGAALLGTAAAAVGLLVVIVDATKFKDGVNEQFRDAVAAGWGIWVAGIGAAAGVLIGIMMLVATADRQDP
jgi:hypothetical protein